MCLKASTMRLRPEFIYQNLYLTLKILTKHNMNRLHLYIDDIHSSFVFQNHKLGSCFTIHGCPHCVPTRMNQRLPHPKANLHYLNLRSCYIDLLHVLLYRFVMTYNISNDLNTS